MRKPVFGVFDQVVWPQKIARGLTFRIYEVEELYYVAKTKGADQLCSNSAADLRICFRIMQKAGILMTRPIQ